MTKMFLSGIACFVFCFGAFAEPNPTDSVPLFRLRQDNLNLWGFVDSTGQFVIAPQFHFVDEFSESLPELKSKVSGDILTSPANS
ncbi:MAG: WG repeat-containing protein [Candidatus Latescibacteria bacterium]|nr:WG repeat-containing protein [Candidatus Latescibacterota bacterium]